MADGNGADPGGGWDISNWLDGFEDSTVQGAVAKVLRDCKKKAGAGTRNDLDWCRELAEKSKNDPGLLAGMLQPITEEVKKVLVEQLGSLDTEDKSTAAVQNDRFIELGGKHMNFGTRDDFDNGLERLIGIPSDDKVLEQMYDEHCNHEVIEAQNYGITTTPMKEWQAAAGRWTPSNKSFEPVEDFKLPGESEKKIREEKTNKTNFSPRVILPLNELMVPKPKVEEESEWKEQEAREKKESPEEREKRLMLQSEESPEERQKRLVRDARRCVHTAGLTEEEVLALRLWSGPMFVRYNAALRESKTTPEKKSFKYTTTLHAVHSGIYKLSKISPPEKVYRGVKNMVISNDKFETGSFVELGAQSFSRNRGVALTYSKPESGESEASYVYEVQEGEVDRGADISPLSYYPHEKEKLYGSLAMMQIIGSRVEGKTVALKMRVNLNAKAGTLEHILSRKHQWLEKSAEMLLDEANAYLKRLEEENEWAKKELASVSRLPELKELKEDLRVEDSRDTGSFMRLSAKLTRTCAGVVAHAKLMLEVHELLTSESGSSTEQTVSEIETLEKELLAARAGIRLQNLEYRLKKLRQQTKYFQINAWRMVSSFLVIAFALGFMWLPWLLLWLLDFAMSFFFNSTVFSGLLNRVDVYWKELDAVQRTAAITTLWPHKEKLSEEMIKKILAPDLREKLREDFRPVVNYNAISKNYWRLYTITLPLWELEIKLLEDATRSLKKKCKGAKLIDIDKTQKKLKELWKEGGVSAKDKCLNGKVYNTVMAAIRNMPTESLADENRVRRFLEAVKHLKNACSEVPIDDANVDVRFYDEWEVAAASFKKRKEGVFQDWEDEFVPLGPPSRAILRRKLKWIHSENALKKRNLRRILELFELGTRFTEKKGGTTQEVKLLSSTTILDEWEAKHAGYFLVTPQYLDSFPLDDLCNSKVSEIEALSLSVQQATMLARFVRLHAPKTITLRVGGESGLKIRLAGRHEKNRIRDLLYDKTPNTSSEPHERLLCDARGSIEFPPNMEVDVLRGLVASVEVLVPRGSITVKSDADDVTKLTVDANEGFCGKDGGGEACTLLLRLVSQAFPQLKELHCRACALADPAGEVIKSYYEKGDRAPQPRLPTKLTTLQLSGNNFSGRAKYQMRCARLWHEFRAQHEGEEPKTRLEKVGLYVFGLDNVIINFVRADLVQSVFASIGTLFVNAGVFAVIALTLSFASVYISLVLVATVFFIVGWVCKHLSDQKTSEPSQASPGNRSPGRPKPAQVAPETPQREGTQDDFVGVTTARVDAAPEQSAVPDAAGDAAHNKQDTAPAPAPASGEPVEITEDDALEAGFGGAAGSGVASSAGLPSCSPRE